MTSPPSKIRLWPNWICVFTIPFSPLTIECVGGSVFVSGIEVLLHRSIVVTAEVGSTTEIVAGDEGGDFSWR